MTNQNLKLILLLLCLVSFGLASGENNITKKVVEIEPVALEVVLPIYDRVLVLFTRGINVETTKMYEEAVQSIIANGKWNNSLFGICDLDKDLSGKLLRFGNTSGLYIITPITHYVYPLPENSNLSKFFQDEIPAFISSHTSSAPSTIPLDTLPDAGFTLLISPSCSEEVSKITEIYHKVYDYLSLFRIDFKTTEPNNNGETTVNIYFNGQKHSEYAKSATQALLNFTDKVDEHEINDLVDFMNIETIGNVSFLDHDNYYRVFGSSVEHQMLLVFKEEHSETEEIKNVLEEFQIAAGRNRVEGLKYERVLFAAATTQFLADYFSDQLLEENQLFSIVITKTDYSSFQLRKFVYEQSEVTSESLLNFIEEVRLKKIDPKYKSEPIPVDNKNQKIRKIVGNNFEHEIFEQAEKSVVVLFVDSKESNESIEIHEALNRFAEKYHEAYREHVHIGVFDLAKNENKLLSISTAPELVVFERTNKKKPKFFRGTATEESIKNWLNYEVKHLTIPENFGEPPIALGGGSSEL